MLIFKGKPENGPIYHATLSEVCVKDVGLCTQQKCTELRDGHNRPTPWASQLCLKIAGIMKQVNSNFIWLPKFPLHPARVWTAHKQIEPFFYCGGAVQTPPLSRPGGLRMYSRPPNDLAWGPPFAVTAWGKSQKAEKRKSAVPTTPSQK